jgi:hypothetical protein
MAKGAQQVDALEAALGDADGGLLAKEEHQLLEAADPRVS